MSIKALIINKVKALNQSYTISGDELRTLCINPEHNDSKPSYFINLKDGKNHCFSCGYAIKPSKLIGDSVEDGIDVEEVLRDAQYSYLEEMLSTKEQEDKVFTLPPKAYDIDKDWRGVSKELLQALGVYYCDTGRFAGRLVFPIYQDDELKGFDARIVNPSIVPELLQDVKWLRPKGMEVQKLCYPFDYLKDLDCTHLVICEGVADCISYLELGVPAIPSFGVSPPETERITALLKLGVSTIGLAYDNDEAGRKASLKVYKDYVQWFKVKNHPLTYKVFKTGVKDCNDYLKLTKGLR